MHETPSQDPEKRIFTRREEVVHSEIPVENVLGEQRLLMRRMVPESIKSYVTESDGENIGIEDSLFIRWNEKYSKLFREYCDSLDTTIDSERERAERIIDGRLTSDDYTDIQRYLEDTTQEHVNKGIGGPFFASKEEEEDFLKQYVH